MSAIVITPAQVQTIGRADNTLQKRAADVIGAMPESFDWKARGAVSAAILAAMGEESHPLPQKKGAKGAQVETPYGVGVRVLADAIRRALPKGDDDTAPVMRVNLKGAGSAVVPADHPAYPLLLALLEGADA